MTCESIRVAAERAGTEAVTFHSLGHDGHHPVKLSGDMILRGGMEGRSGELCLSRLYMGFFCLFVLMTRVAPAMSSHDGIRALHTRFQLFSLAFFCLSPSHFSCPVLLCAPLIIY
ncbi:hypothetical protein V8F06_006049 [Rhypophila decipiens]